MTDRGKTYTIRDVHQSAVGVMLEREQRWLIERDRIARILDTFARAPISMASIQPILDLAVEMNVGKP